MACQGQTKDTDILIKEPHDLDEYPDIINLLADYVNIWDVTFYDDSISEITLYGERYSAGEDGEILFEFMNPIKTEKTPLSLQVLVAKQTFEQKAKLIASFIDDDDISSIETSISLPDDGSFSKAYSTASTPVEVNKGEKIVLFSIIAAEMETDIAISAGFELDIDEVELARYEYIFRIVLETK